MVARCTCIELAHIGPRLAACPEESCLGTGDQQELLQAARHPKEQSAPKAHAKTPCIMRPGWDIFAYHPAFDAVPIHWVFIYVYDISTHARRSALRSSH